MKSAVLFILVVLALAACGDDSGPNPGPDTPPPATTDSGVTPITQPPNDPNACKLEVKHAVILKGVWASPGKSIVIVAGTTTPTATFLRVSFAHQGQFFTWEGASLLNTGGFYHDFHTKFPDLSEATITFVVSKFGCNTLTVKVIAKPGPMPIL